MVRLNLHANRPIELYPLRLRQSISPESLNTLEIGAQSLSLNAPMVPDRQHGRLPLNLLRLLRGLK